MAAEMSCLAGVDAEDKEADPEINALMLMQEPLRMTSCTDAFSKSLCQNSVLDVLSSEDMLSPVGLGNGPSVHQPTEAHELNSFSNEKEEEKNITPLKTVQEIGGMWDFDIDSPEDSSDNFNNPGNISWDSHKNLMQFLESWNHEDSPGEGPKEEVPPPDIPKRRKRKMDMVVMVDPSEELFPPEGEEDDFLVKKVRKPRLSPSRMSPSRKVSKYTNGTVNSFKHILYSSPTTNLKQNSLNHEPSPLKNRLSLNSYSEKQPQFPCSKCNQVFKKQHLLDHHMKSHTEQLRPFICKECGKSFKKSGFLIGHMAQVHKDSLHVERKGCKDKPQTLYCPQCSFGTDSPNEFVKHAKTHEKDKRKIELKCEKCNFKTDDESFLRKHNVMQHTVLCPKKPAEKKIEKETFTCNICCNYKTFSKLVFKKHLLRRHDQSLDEYEAEHGDITAQSKWTVPSAKFPLRDAVFTSRMSIESQNMPKRVLSKDSKSISDFFKDSSVGRGSKLVKAEPKLEESINELLSRQMRKPMAIDQRKEANGKSSEKDPYELPESPLSQNEQAPPELKLDPSLSPCHSTSADEDTKPPRPKGPEEGIDIFEKRDLSPYRDADSNHIDSIFKRQKQIIYTYSRRMSMRGALQASKKLYEKIKNEEQEQCDVEIKDEDMYDELVVEKDSPTPQSSPEDVKANHLDRKNCPHCSAVFESGVGLSNHIRGHLHRIGLNYKARHKVSADQVATSEETQPIGPRISTLLRQKEPPKDAFSEAAKMIHSCPLCGDVFDNRTGQANHIRGHLKKLGKGLIAKHRSPLLLLRELMRDKNEYKRALELIGKNNHVQCRTSSKLSDIHSFTPRSTDSVKYTCPDVKPLAAKLPFDNIISEKGHPETNLDIKNSLSGNSALIGILKKRKCQEDSRLVLSANIEQSSGSRLASVPPLSVCAEKDGFKRKTCIHCNASFHSGVSLSNHLRACTRRKRNALPDGNVLDGKVRRQRMRPGPKKKVLPLPQTPEDMYRLTCRFCDLVFQGPLSVQEDWVKHLQRHIMNTSVPHTGLAMVEVSSVPKEPRKYEHDANTSVPC